MSTIRTKTEQTTQVVTSTSSSMREPGICTTCNHVRTCLFHQASRNPVWYCDEFDDSKAEAAQPQTAAVAKPGELVFGEALREGLCVNCETRGNCSHRKPGVPVFECEDYA